MHADLAPLDLPAERRIRTEQQLLPGLSAAVKGARHLHAPERPVRQLTAIFPGEGHAERDALIDNLGANLREPIHVRFAGAEVPPFDGVIKQARNTIAVVLIVLGRIDSPLCGNAMRPTRTVLDAKAIHLVAELCQGRGGARSGKPASHHKDAEPALIVGADQLFAEPVTIPLGFQGSGRNFRIEGDHQRTIPAMTASTITMLPVTIIKAIVGPAA